MSRGALVEQRVYKLGLNGLNLHVTEWGRADASPVVMLHGIRGYSATFDGVAAALQPEFRVIAYDQRGRGESDWDPRRDYYTDTYVRDLLGVADALGLDSFDLLGHSMGGIVAMVFAATYPARLRRMVIEDAGLGAFEASSGAQRIQKELAATPTVFANWSEAQEFMRRLRPSVSEEARQQRLRNMLKQRDDGSFTWRYDHEGIAATRLHPDPARLVDLAEHVPRITCPTLVIRGGRSDYLQSDMAQRMCASNARIQAVEIPDAGHYVHDDQPELFEAQVASFFRTAN